MKGRNNKGLVTMDRKSKKDSYYIYQAYWSKTPMVHITGKRYAKRAGDPITVKVYSNQLFVTLFVDGQRVDEKEVHDHICTFDLFLR